MSDLVVVEEQGATVVIQEVAAADIIEVVAAGPQGAQGDKGDKGDKGDTGDVTPEATAAKVAAQAAATAAASSQTAAASSATSAANSATSASTSAATANTKASEASTSATAAATSATSAAGSASTATTKASEASASATGAAASAATATTKASEASTSASGAATSASSAATSASTATAKASEAASSATAAQSSATAAASSASTATAKASEASTSAAGAATSATNAATSATNAGASATAAATSASAANTSATNAATSASTATTKASEAAASATTASTAASTATTKATEAAASQAAAASSAATASTQAGIATTKATEASNSASAALDSKQAAETAATAAATSASNANTSAVNAAASEDAVAADAATATAQAGIATTKASEAASSASTATTQAGIATTQAGTATTKASEAAASATTAATQAGIATTKAGEAASSASSAATEAATATTQAGVATTKATEAAASATSAASSQTSAAASATTATTQAGVATTKAGEAAASADTATTQAGIATTKAAEAASSATAASTAQIAAESARDQTLAAFDSFDDRYLGQKASDPTVDNDGNPLVGGALYYNSAPLNSGGGMKVYDAAGGVWLAAYASLSGALISANNLSDLSSASAARINLGLGDVENKSSATIRSELTSSNVTTALGFTPYSAANPAGYITSSDLAPYLTTASASSTYQTILVSGTSIKTVNGVSVLGSGNIQIDGGVTSFNTRTGAVTLGSGDVTAALGFTPYDAANPSGYVAAAGARAALSFTAGSGAYDSATGVITIPTNTNQLTNGAGFTTNTGTVTSVSGAGTVSGLTLTGTVTGSGSLTLGGTLSLTSGQVTTALGYTPVNPTAVGSTIQGYDADLAAIAALAGTSGLLRKTAADTWSLDTATYLTGINSSQVTTALGFTPYDSANPAGYITSSALTPYLTSATAASTYQPIGSYLTGITGAQVTTALGYTPANKAGDTFTGAVLTSNAGGFTANSAAKLWTDSSRGRLDLYEGAAQTKSLRVFNANGYGIMGMTSAENLELWTNGVARLTLGGSGNVTASTNILVNNGTDSRLLLQVSGVTEGQVQSTASTIRLSSNNTLPLVLATNGVDRLTLASDGLVTFGASTYVGLGGAPSASARLRVVGTGLSSELARIEGGTLDASFIVNQTDDPTVNTLRAQISLRKNNVIGATISIDGSAANRGIVYYDASSATGSHAFYVNSVDRFRVNAVGAVSFSGAYGTAGQMLKSGGSAGVPTWAALTSGEVTTALGFTPYNATNPSGYITSSALTPYLTTATAASTYQPIGSYLTSISSSDVTTALGYTPVNPTAIGSTIQGYDADLAAIAGLAGTSGLLKKTAANTWVLDTATYLTGITSSQVTTALGFTPYNATNPAGYLTSSGSITGSAATLTTGRTIAMTGDVTYTSGSFNGSANVTGTATLANSGVTAGTYTKVTVDAKGRVTVGASLASADVTTALGFTPYSSANPSGYTSNTGTVTSVSGDGTVSGLTLTGTVTGSGSLTLGGTLALTSGQVTTALGFTPGVGDVTLAGAQTLTNKVITGIKETQVAMPANNIDLAGGNYFTKTITAATTLTVSNVPSTGTATSFILNLTNGGSGTITWWSGVKWAGGTAPTLTAAGRDVLGFFTHDGGTTWTGLVLGKDVK